MLLPVPCYSPSLWGSRGRIPRQLVTSQSQPRAARNECRFQTVCLIVLGSLAFACSWFRSPCLGNGASHGGLDLPTSINLRQSPSGMPTPAPRRLFLIGTLFPSDPGLCEVDGLNYRSAQGSYHRGLYQWEEGGFNTSSSQC